MFSIMYSQEETPLLSEDLSKYDRKLEMIQN